jgi:hypothetical protein
MFSEHPFPCIEADFAAPAFQAWRPLDAWLRYRVAGDIEKTSWTRLKALGNGDRYLSIRNAAKTFHKIGRAHV